MMYRVSTIRKLNPAKFNSALTRYRNFAGIAPSLLWSILRPQLGLFKRYEVVLAGLTLLLLCVGCKKKEPLPLFLQSYTNEQWAAMIAETTESMKRSDQYEPIVIEDWMCSDCNIDTTEKSWGNFEAKLLDLYGTTANLKLKEIEVIYCEEMERIKNQYRDYYEPNIAAPVACDANSVSRGLFKR